MFPLLIALVVFVVAGIAITALLRKRATNSDELRLGLAHLAGLRWREFAKLVLQAMQARGYEVVHEDGAADDLTTDGGDILLRQGSQRTLLSCKYGNASVIGAQPILGLGKSAELRGAHSSIVVTPGRFDDAAQRAARQQHVELIDGATLWPEVRPFIGHDISQQAGVHAAKRNAMVAWLGAAALAAVSWMLAQGVQNAPSAGTSSEVAATPVAAAPGTASRRAPQPAVQEAIPTDPAALEHRRVETANAISTLHGVDRAIWSTQSTLLVHLSSDAEDPSNTLCPLLERYPELASSRVQLQPPPGSEKPVRFKQCRSY